MVNAMRCASATAIRHPQRWWPPCVWTFLQFLKEGIGDRRMEAAMERETTDCDMVRSAAEECTDEQVKGIEHMLVPHAALCSGMFTANSMNCLNEAIGLALPAMEPLKHAPKSKSCRYCRPTDCRKCQRSIMRRDIVRPRAVSLPVRPFWMRWHW